MKKVFISVVVPAIFRIYDFRIPLNMKIREGIALIYQIIGEEYVGVAKDFEAANLFMTDCNIILNKDTKFLDYFIKDEDKFILI
jgi:uncharacterized ubiquitin-like protein YukD